MLKSETICIFKAMDIQNKKKLIKFTCVEILKLLFLEEK